MIVGSVVHRMGVLGPLIRVAGFENFHPPLRSFVDFESQQLELEFFF